MLNNPFSSFNPKLSREENIEQRLDLVKSFKAKANAKRSPAEKFADWMTEKFGSIVFLSINGLWFFGWIIINTGLVPGIKPFDPFPFGLLTMIVSLEAIFLAIIVLISQNREARIAEIRDEIELQVGTISEGELTKLMSLMILLLEKQGIKVEHDKELNDMLKPIDNEKIEQEIENELHPGNEGQESP